MNKLELYADNFCKDVIVKISFIRKLPNGMFAVVSHKGKILGRYKTKHEAAKRLRQIEFFKHKKAEDNSYSSIMRGLDNDEKVKFQKEFKSHFDQAFIDGDENPEDAALEAAVEKMTINKVAAAVDLGDSNAAGKYLADLVRFLLKRISPEKRNRSINNLRKKIYYLNEYDMAAKKTPPSSSLGQSITLLKTILLEHSPQYIREVLNSIVRNL